MASRMDKYHKNDDQSKSSRLEKNSLLYEELYTNKVFTGFTKTLSDNAIELGSIDLNSVSRRENHQRNKLLLKNQSENFEKDVVDESILPEEDDRVYNINDVLELAKKNRIEIDQLEKKRKLRTVEYNILSDLSKEKLDEIREKKHDKLSKDEEDNLEELINTITSKSLRKKIDDELLDELMPTRMDETIISEQLIDQLAERIEEDYNDVEYQNTEETPKIDYSFYTRSMDLSEEDFIVDSGNLDESFIENDSKNWLRFIFILLFVIVIIGLICYIIYKYI